ncbi:hypothetical protein OsI_06050 [Oryza sativa Indica Group]|uniref:FLZ-type domain-containing protein n=1 Tax=Oryza sativa subsp. indica TaxID=39946 RepID=B8AIJ9_ORYSI|nr:hypothetical protein OsI_06050 [Oryza sativa Indica Group]
MAMDPDAAEWPCIIQALPALPPSPSSTGVPRLPTMVQALPAATDPPPAAAAAARLRRGAEPPSPRRTRSGGAPEWTPAETLALVAEVAAVDDGWSRSVSAFQKGEKAFCSSECRCHQMLMDDHADNCGSEALKANDYSASPHSAPLPFSLSVAAA